MFEIISSSALGSLDSHKPDRRSYPVWWLCFERNGELLGVAIVEASSLPAARLRVCLDRICPQIGVSVTGHELDPRCRAVLSAGETGRMLSFNDAANLLERFDRAAGKKPPTPSIRRLRALAQAAWAKP